MNGLMSGVGIGLSIMGLLVGILVLVLLDLGIAATAKGLGLLGRSRPISLFPDRQEGLGSGAEAPENNRLQQTAGAGKMDAGRS